MSGLAAVLTTLDGKLCGGASQLVNQMRGGLGCASEAFDSWSERGVSVAWDCSAKPRFIQRAANKDRSLHVWMEGELFDLKKEREILARAGHGLVDEYDDPQICLGLFAEFGSEVFARLNGSFALVIYDATAHELILVSDRTGSHPLFYYHKHDLIASATQVRAFARTALPGLGLDLQAVVEFFTFEMLLGDRTYYENVKMLPPGSLLRFRNGSAERITYWTARFEPTDMPEHYYVEALAAAFQSAVERRTRDSKRHGLLLSGGLDSRGILGADLERRISVAITIGDSRNREVQLAERLAATAGCQHVFLPRDEDYYCRIVHGAIDICDGMDSFNHAHFLGFQEHIKQCADVILHGWWLDDIAKGGHLPLRSIGCGKLRVDTPLVQTVHPEDIYRVIMGCSYKHQRRDRVFAPALQRRVQEYIRASLEPTVRDLDAYAQSIANVGPYLFLTSSAFKHHTALNSLCLRPFVVERTIALDNDLLDLYLETPVQYKAAGRVFKKALTLIAPDLLAIKNSNTRLRADASVWKEKTFSNCRRFAALFRRVVSKQSYSYLTQGSWPNLNELIRQNERMQAMILSTINDEECLNPDIFDVGYAHVVYQDHMLRKTNASDLLFLFLTFGIWNRKYRL